MKFELKSNYNDFSKRWNKLPDLIDEATYNTVNKILYQMCEDMKREIAENTATWLGHDTTKLFGLGNDIEYEVSGNYGTIYVGRNTPELQMADGRTVNPYLFIQFGFGIEGEANPVRYANQRRWEYNINDHVKAWWYADENGDVEWSVGRIGIDFFYAVIDKYRDQWKKIAQEEFGKILL